MKTIRLTDQIYVYELIRSGRKSNYLRKPWHVEFFKRKVKIGFFLPYLVHGC